jgi:NADH-quinone oxidoreductase subunit L
MDFSFTIWIVLLPFISFAVISLAGKKINPMISAGIASTAMLAALVLSLVTAYAYFFNTFSPEEGHSSIIAAKWTWLNFNEVLHIDMGLLLDPISVMMLVVITLISSLVHVYSIGYMMNDVGYSRYFGFLSLFSFSMLGLVVATNLFQMYMFWELVGLSSYLLIGHYYDKPSAVAASKKAFIVTRFADLGFLIGILLLSYFTGSFDFETITDASQPAYLAQAGASFMGLSVISWALILVFMGGAGKSAMFPLHIWLPDAMEGPTPVSALIHAATMVVAGIYLVARMFTVFAGVAPDALQVVAFIGAFTSLFAAVIACTQEDIKRVLAYSTMSQLGYMMLALGVSSEVNDNLGFTASMFHLFTHAMFKALLFLGAGAVIHAVHSNLMKDMGGLRKKMPITAITFLIACLAISGIPPFAGFFSKDEILAAAYQANPFYYYVELFVAGLTAFYMFRLYFKIFWHQDKEYSDKVHEVSAVMSIPLIILAILSATVGFLPFGELVTADGMPHHSEFHWNVAISSIFIAVLGIFFAYRLYVKDRKKAAPDSTLYKAAVNKFYIDEIYMFITKKIIFAKISVPVAWFDRHIVDGTMNGVAWITNTVSDRIKGMQSGQLQHYLFAFISGAIALFLFILYMIS